MTTLTLRPFAGEADLQPICDLLNLCDEMDRLGDPLSIADLGRAFADPRFDPQRDVRLWQVDGALAGVGWVNAGPVGDSVAGHLWLYVHPDGRGSGLDSQVAAWAEERMAAVGQERGAPATIETWAGAGQADRVALLEGRGFTVTRSFLTMALRLDQPIAEPALPEGFGLRPVDAAEDGEAWVELFNQSFVDHWNHHPLTVERFQYRRSIQDYDPAHDLVVVAPDGRLAAFCHSQVTDGRGAPPEGRVLVLGTRRGFRRLGLGRATLLAALRRLQVDRVALAKLNVDAASPTGATRLYEKVGFHTVQTWIVYVKTL